MDKVWIEIKKEVLRLEQGCFLLQNIAVPAASLNQQEKNNITGICTSSRPRGQSDYLFVASALLATATAELKNKNEMILAALHDIMH